LTVLVGLLCRMEDFDEIAMFGEGQLSWLRRFLPFRDGVAPAQTLRRVLRALDPKALERAFSAWVASLQAKVSGVVAIDGKTLRGTKQDKSGAGALHVVSAFAHEAGLVLAARAVEAKGNEITAIPELLDMLAIEGAIVTIDAIGTQKAIAAKVVEKQADLSSRSKKTRAPSMPMSLISSPTRRSRVPVSRTGRLNPVTAGSRSAGPGPPTQLGSPSGIRSGRACAPSPRSPRCAPTKRAVRPRPKRGSISPRCRPIRRAFSPPAGRIGASKTTCIGSSTSPSGRTMPNPQGPRRNQLGHDAACSTQSG
jgi:hypothetical protein